jgi:hypothetical protein
MLGPKRCFIGGLVLHRTRALLSALSPELGVLILGDSVLEGIGTALLIPAVYILTALRFRDLTNTTTRFSVGDTFGWRVDAVNESGSALPLTAFR